MIAVVLNRYGGPEVLAIADLPAPTPGPGQVLVTLAAAGVNPVDAKMRSGAEQPAAGLPLILGWDLAGTITAVGTGVTGWQPGDQVIAMSAGPATGRGTHAEHVALPADLLAPWPAAIPDPAQAGSIALPALAAQHAVDQAQLTAGDRLLVIGAAGAVGSWAVQLAHLTGARVTAAVTRHQDHNHVLALGAAAVLDSADTHPSSPASFDAVLDSAGDITWLPALRDGGSWTTVVPEALPASERDITTAVSYVEEDGAALAWISSQLDHGRLRPPRIAHVLPLTQAVEAHRLLEAHAQGKVVLTAENY